MPSVERAQRLVEKHGRVQDRRRCERHPAAAGRPKAARGRRRSSPWSLTISSESATRFFASCFETSLAHSPNATFSATERCGKSVFWKTVLTLRLVGGRLHHVHPVQQDRPSSALEPGDETQRGRLAAAGGTEQREELAGRHRQVDHGDRRDRPRGNRFMRSTRTTSPPAMFAEHTRGPASPSGSADRNRSREGYEPLPIGPRRLGVGAHARI